MLRLLPLIAGAGLLAFAGCTGAAGPAAEPAPGGQSLRDPNAGALLGLYDLHISPSTASVSLSPHRVAQALGDNFDVDITLFSTETLLVKGFEFPNPTTLRVEFEFAHPLPNTTNRKDLSVFDLRAHFLSPNTNTTFAGTDGVTAPTGASGAAEDVKTADVPLANASGWSSWVDEVVEPSLGDEDPNVYPFLLVHEDTGRAAINPNTPVGWNVIPMATTPYSFDADFNLADGAEVSLKVALDASYGASAMKSIANPGVGSRLNPRYLNPEFNLKEGYKTSVVATGTPQVGNNLSGLDLVFSVWDHQGSLVPTGDFDPLTDPADSLRYSSDLKEAVFACEFLTNSITFPKATFTGTGLPADPYVYDGLIGGGLFDTAGTGLAIVAIRDEMVDSATETAPLPTQGYTRDLAVTGRRDFTTYIVFPITVDPAGPATWTQIHDMIVNGDPNTVGDQPCMQCHVGCPNGLCMDANSATTYANLVNVMSTCGEDYIEPNNPGLSFFYEKIQPSPACGLQMPQSGPPYWSAAAVAMVNDWIMSGAPNN